MPSKALEQALANPLLDVAPALPVTATGHVAATPAQIVDWLTYHGKPVPPDLAAMTNPAPDPLPVATPPERR